MQARPRTSDATCFLSSVAGTWLADVRVKERVFVGGWEAASGSTVRFYGFKARRMQIKIRQMLPASEIIHEQSFPPPFMTQ